MYEIRMQLQRLNADTLDQHMVINSTGELRLLQRDIANVVKRLHFSFLELKEHTEQTEDDFHTWIPWKFKTLPIVRHATEGDFNQPVQVGISSQYQS